MSTLHAAERGYTYGAEVDIKIKECPVCGVVYGIPTTLSSKRRNDGGNWFCPNGHSLIYTHTESQRQKERAEAAERRAEQAESAARRQRERAERERRSAIALRGHLTRMRNRIAAGVCPVPGCRRSGFAQVMRHLASKHPDWLAEHAVHLHPES